MKNTFTERENLILEWLSKNGSATIQELADACLVSPMTIHRDLNRLAEKGHVQKSHGSVTLAKNPEEMIINPCDMCGKSTVGKSVFIIHLGSGDQRRACCAHCGLMLQQLVKGAWHSMTMDFLHGHMISAHQAVYLVGCDLNICCVPTILTFGSRSEAARFQAGFGGSLVTMEEAIRFLMI